MRSWIFSIALCCFVMQVSVEAKLLSGMPHNNGSMPAVSPATVQAFANHNWQSIRAISSLRPATIIAPGKKRADGLFTPAKVRPHSVPEPGSYLPGVVVIKTRQQFPVVDGNRALGGSSLNSIFKLYGIRSIRQPFGANAAQLQQMTDYVGVRRIYEVRYTAPVDPVDLCRELEQHPEIEYAEPLYIRQLLFRPNDPRFSQQKALDLIQAAQAWDITKGSGEVTIAILDSGTDWEHEDLRDNIWTNPNEIPDNGVDDDGNGKVDDVHGWDFVGDVSVQDVQQGIFREDNDPKVRNITPPGANDTRSHGTNVAGNASAVTNNGKGIASIGYQCKLIPVKLASDQPIGGIFRGYEAILYAARLGADVINLSWGSPQYASYEQDVINQATAMGSLVVAASGNASMFTDVNIPYFPAQYDNVLNVGASDRDDNPAPFTHYGTAVDVYAPGVANWSTMPGNSYLSHPNWSGTSFAAPIVSGIAALVRTLHPDWTPKQIAHQIRSTVDNVFPQVQQNPGLRPFLYGRVNAYKAVRFNQSFTSGDRIPGVEITAIGIAAANGVISTYDPVQVRLTVKNFLAPTSNLQLRLFSFDGFTILPDQPITVGSIGTLDSQNVDVTIQLSPLQGWFEGTVDFLVVFQDGDYVDYQRIELPVRIPSPHTYVAFPLPHPAFTHVVYFDAESPSPSVFWAVGFLPGAGAAYLVASQSQIVGAGLGTFSNFAADPAFAVAALDLQRAWISTNGANGGNTTIWRTTDGGQQWQTVSVAHITDFINDLHFFNPNEGIFLGDPKGGRWGVARTTDGGVTWKIQTGLPAPQPQETGLVGSRFWLDEAGWFGTTKGRVFYTTDKGATWKVSTIDPTAMVVFLSFTTPQKGIALYQKGQGSFRETFVAATTDGGATWQPLNVRLTQAGITPVMAFAPANSRWNYLIDDNGRVLATEDNGSSWEVMLTRELTQTRMAALSWRGSTVRIWNIGPRGLGYLNLPYEEAPIPKVLEASVSTLDFGNVTVGATATQFVRFQNTGQAPVTITAVAIQPQNAQQDEFTLINKLPNKIQPGEEKTLGIRFQPAVEGNRTAVLRVESDADNGTVTVQLVGTGTVTSVPEHFNAGLDVRILHQNPPALEVSSQRSYPLLRATLYTVQGQRLWSRTFAVAPSQPWRWTLPPLAAGSYAVRIDDGQRILWSRVVLLP